MIKESEIGKNIKKYRKIRRATLQELADASGYTKGYISKLEKSEKAPPLSTLSNIAKVLGVTTSVLLGESARRTSISFIRKDERSVIAGIGTAFGYAYESIAHNYPDRNMQPFVLTLPVKPKQQVIFQHDSEEMLFVLKGTMNFRYGDKEFEVNEGDCVYFDGNIPHYGESSGDEEAVCLMVMHER
ncbi:MAG: helix-turn-helix transcriptional regulator [Deltaproteobacteria bacterium]|nr:helix-turn-helix transcriptional regulator [Deltaproteobacteria bacterium]